MPLKRLYRCAHRRALARAVARWAALLLGAACVERSVDSAVPAPPPAEVALAPAPRPPGQGSTEAEPRGFSWAAPASAPALSLHVALDAGGGPAYVNAGGDLLLAASVVQGTGEEAEDLPALALRDASGAGRWARAYGPDARLRAALLDDDGSALAAGDFTGVLNLGTLQLESFRNPTAVFGGAGSQQRASRRGERSRDLLFLRLTPEGEVAWARRFGDAGDQWLAALAPTASGEWLAVGTFAGQLVMDQHSVLSSTGGSGADVFVARLDRDGHVTSLWREEPLQVDAVLVEPDGSLWIAGRQDQLRSNRLWKLSPDGQRQVSVIVNDQSGARAQKLAPGPGGSLYAVYSETEWAPIFGRRVAGYGALVRLSAAGEVEWLQELRADFAHASVAADAAGNVALAGAYRPSIDLGAGPLESSGGTDIFVASFAPQGDLRYSVRLGSTGFDGINDISARPSGGWLVPFYVERPFSLLEQQVSGGEHLLWIDEHQPQ